MSFLSNLFGGGAPKINFQPAGFNSGGVSANFSGGKYGLTESPALSGAVGNLSATFGQQAGALQQLGKTVAPGFSDFRKAGLADLTTQQQATTSNLRDNLAQRRILGSSFAQDSISRADAEYASKRADFIAQASLQELQASDQIIQQQFQASTSMFKVGIDQMNFESAIAADLTGKASTALASVATAQAKLDAENAAGIGKFVGSLLTAPGSSVFGKGVSSVSSLFGGGGSAAADAGSMGAAGGGSAGADLFSTAFDALALA